MTPFLWHILESKWTFTNEFIYTQRSNTKRCDRDKKIRPCQEWWMAFKVQVVVDYNSHKKQCLDREMMDYEFELL